MPAIAKRALIVDDDQATCELIERALTSVGMDSLSVTSSEDVPEILRRARFAVAFLDHHMKSPDGPALARQMRSSGSNRLTPIILISDDKRPAAVSEGFDAGASFFLYKPIDKDRVLRLIRASQSAIDHGMRRTRRVDLKAPIRISFAGQAIEGETLNLSLEGMLVRVPRVLPIGSSVEVQFQTGKMSKPIAAFGSVVRLHGREEMGIHLARLTVDDSQRLQDCLLPLIAIGST